MSKTTYEFITDRFEQIFAYIKNSDDSQEIKSGQLQVLYDAIKSLEIRSESTKQKDLVTRLQNFRADVNAAIVEYAV